MKSGVLLMTVVAGVTASAVAFLTTKLATPAMVERPVAAPARGEAALRARLDALNREIDLLRERLAMLESLPAAAVRSPLARAAEIDTRGAEVVHTSSLPGGETSDNLIASVDAALQQIREDERREAEARREAVQLVQIDQRLERLQERLGLTEYQVDEMRKVLRREEALSNDLRTLREEADDRELYREQRRALEEETRASLATILTPEQLEGYERNERRGNNGGRRNEAGGNGQRRDPGGERGDRQRGG